jgi:hypothetical protein
VSTNGSMVSAMTLALSETHSSQMKTHTDVIRLLHPPSTRARTSCSGLPQNEQDTAECGPAVPADPSTIFAPLRSSIGRARDDALHVLLDER